MMDDAIGETPTPVAEPAPQGARPRKPKAETGPRATRKTKEQATKNTGNEVSGAIRLKRDAAADPEALIGSIKAVGHQAVSATVDMGWVREQKLDQRRTLRFGNHRQ